MRSLSVDKSELRTESCAGKILFYCSQAPSCGGGQTPICDMRKVLSDIETHRDTLGHLLDHGVRYCRSGSKHKYYSVVYSMSTDLSVHGSQPYTIAGLTTH